MRKLLPLLLCFALACNLVTRAGAPSATPAPLSTPTTALPMVTVDPPITVAAPAAPEAPPTPCQLQLETSGVLIHPEPALYSGDKVSLEVLAESTCAAWQDASVSVYLGSRANPPLSTTRVAPYGLGARQEAAFTWVWDTAGLIGPQTLVITAQPANVRQIAPEALTVLTLTVKLLPADERPLPEPAAQWETTESACCVFHYLSDTAAARDIEEIKAEADQALARVEAVLGVKQAKKIEINLLSRLLGHGGFASSSISLTYIDRNPVGNNLPTLLAHEQTHVVDQQLTRTRPSLMAEGLAVYVAGGHFKPDENLTRRAAALLALGRYLPLTGLADSFYPAQHETGYLEGSAFVTYLVETYGWEQFKQFYSSFKPGPDRPVLDTALNATYGKRLSHMEADWLTYLKAQPVTPAEMENLRLSLLLYDTLRRYQNSDDPAAFYLTAWTPDVTEAIRRGIVADYVRHPAATANIAIEAMLASAEHAMEAGDYPQAEKLLNSVNAVLDTHNLFFDPLAASYLQVVSTLSAAGYETQSITLGNARTATTTAIRDWPALETLALTRTSEGWQIAPASP